MRVIAGRGRGRKLHVPRGNITRPTPDRVRESLFSHLALNWQDAVVLDLFAGTGALGIEALSRGARHATFVEQHRHVLRCLRQNLMSWGAQAELVDKPVVAALAALTARGCSFDVIFLDPPYAAGLVPATLRQVAENGLLRHRGLCVAEYSASAPSPEPPSLWRTLGSKTYGEVGLVIMQRDDRAGPDAASEEINEP